MMSIGFHPIELLILGIVCLVGILIIGGIVFLIVQLAFKKPRQ
jgi:hypothetical protein